MNLCFWWHFKVAKPVSKEVIKRKQEKQKNNCSRSPQPWVAGGTIPQRCVNIPGKEHEAQRPARPGAHPEPQFLLLPTTEEGKLQRNVGVRAQLRIEHGSDGTLKEAASLLRSQLAAPRHPVLWQFTRPPAPESLLDCSDARQRQEPQLLEAWGRLAHLDGFRLAQHRGQTAVVFGWIILMFLFLLRSGGPQGTLVSS